MYSLAESRHNGSGSDIRSDPSHPASNIRQVGIHSTVSAHRPPTRLRGNPALSPEEVGDPSDGLWVVLGVEDERRHSPAGRRAALPRVPGGP